MSTVFFSPNVWPIYYRFVLISKGAQRLVALKNGAGLECEPTNPAALRVTELTEASKNIRPGHRAIAKQLARRGHRLFLLTGVRAVELAHVDAFEGKKRITRLDVQVAEVIKVPVAFHVVRHVPQGKSGFVTHSKKWTTREELSGALRVAHQIYRQAAIALEMDSYNFADVKNDLGVEVDLRKENSPGWAALRAHSKKSVVNVFVVGKVINKTGQASHGATVDLDCVVDTTEPSEKEFGQLIAHELGHAFDMGHTTNSEGSRPTRFLMSQDIPGEFDAGIARNTAKAMRGAAKRIK
jgi:hypothetical protein